MAAWTEETKTTEYPFNFRGVRITPSTRNTVEMLLCVLILPAFLLLFLNVSLTSF